MKSQIMLIYGGKSVEHDISIITALQTIKFLPKNINLFMVYIDKNGDWWSADNLNDIKIYSNFKKLAKNPHKITIVMGQNMILIQKRKKFVPFCYIQSVLNCCHGAIGEDGSLSGVFETCEIPYSSSGLVSSAICMDKSFMKDILKANDINTPQYVYFNKCTFNKSKVLKQIKFPLIVKPSNLGSSIGISVCHNEDEFDEAVELAFSFDEKILVEKLVENLKEFNCACFSYNNEVFSSSVCEVSVKGEIFSFDDKYISTNGKIENVDKKLSKKIKSLTEKVYQIFDCKGVVRVDFLYDENAKILYVNEINTIPGSLAFYLFEGINFTEILNSILQQCKDNLEKKQSLIKTFDSDALKIYEKACKTVKK